MLNGIVKNINGIVNLGGIFMNLGKENETTEFKETTSELRQALMDNDDEEKK